MASKTKLTKADYIKTGMRAYYIQNGFNYGNYQGLGYANMLYPALKKMYKGDDDALQAALQDNIEFYNTNIHFVPFITSLHLAMLEESQRVCLRHRQRIFLRRCRDENRFP
mgnify:CR=1 FL=1